MGTVEDMPSVHYHYDGHTRPLLVCERDDDCPYPRVTTDEVQKDAAVPRSSLNLLAKVMLRSQVVTR